MKKKYEQPQENNEANDLHEPMAEYITETEMIPSPPLTEEELANALTGEEFLETVLDHIDKLFDKK
ncbi:DNA-binding transcriptional regulator LsrR (DeoR family) [Parabacteroides sp. PFB2-12]|uniref:hypothetical protein n=1 Tax=unclassified Parabacteroides TaxID=2649774 RepID=UPI002474DD30|nr:MULTISPECIES: hypothetical protein [unclassified Parabacteroides]MDH6341708.1 DNA-binding transcriptional regulator LsrR (DeoR family) [Parabacteroides sp. PM6-13]MDH6389869.1 DNA-binding transcriptional regulator LsrR (DeoR family) [Parabacteroides sp. PFB2-12]